MHIKPAPVVSRIVSPKFSYRWGTQNIRAVVCRKEYIIIFAARDRNLVVDTPRFGEFRRERFCRRSEVMDGELSQFLHGS